MKTSVKNRQAQAHADQFHRSKSKTTGPKATGQKPGQKQPESQNSQPRLGRRRPDLEALRRRERPSSQTRYQKRVIAGATMWECTDCGCCCIKTQPHDTWHDQIDACIMIAQGVARQNADALKNLVH